MSTRRHLLPAATLVAVASLLATPAGANPKQLPFTYPYETQPEGALEIEQYLDQTPIKKYNDDRTKRVFDSRYRLQTEFEYGITDRLEVALYLVYGQDAPTQGDPTLKFDGSKQRIRYRVSDEGKLPVDISLYFEVAEYHDEFELEQKVILQKRFGDLKLMANLWVEQEWGRGKAMEFILNPTGGASYQLHPMASVGLEYWGRGMLENEAAEEGADPKSVDYFNAAFHHYVGPALHLNFGRLWWSTAAYLRLDEMGRRGEVGDKYGKVWIRSIVGLSL